MGSSPGQGTTGTCAVHTKCIPAVGTQVAGGWGFHGYVGLAAGVVRAGGGGRRLGTSTRRHTAALPLPVWLARPQDLAALLSLTQPWPPYPPPDSRGALHRTPWAKRSPVARTTRSLMGVQHQSRCTCLNAPEGSRTQPGSEPSSACDRAPASSSSSSSVRTSGIPSLSSSSDMMRGAREREERVQAG